MQTYGYYACMLCYLIFQETTPKNKFKIPSIILCYKWKVCERVCPEFFDSFYSFQFRHTRTNALYLFNGTFIFITLCNKGWMCHKTTKLFCRLLV